MSRIIAPSILAADFGNLESEIKKINATDAQWIHCDIMDGVFVPNISLGIPAVSCVSKLTEKPLDVHLMLIEPERFITKFSEAGANHLTIHYEACRHLHKAISKIRELGMKPGVSLCPHTPINVLEEIIADVDILLVMSVNPGFGGQKLIENTYDKVSRAKDLILKKNANTLIQVDGGVHEGNARRLFDAGVDVLVAGTAVFKAEDPSQAVNNLLLA